MQGRALLCYSDRAGGYFERGHNASCRFAARARVCRIRDRFARTHLPGSAICPGWRYCRGARP
eukprot:11170258-Lingulodinium_polyedra.AAC.1